MTKQLAPIVELAEQCEIASIDSSVTIYLDRLDYGTTTEQSFIASISGLEQLRQAIIADPEVKRMIIAEFVSTLEPVAWRWGNKETWIIADEQPVKCDDNITIQPLYDLSEWIEK